MDASKPEQIFLDNNSPQAVIKKLGRAGLSYETGEFRYGGAAAKLELGPKGFYGLSHMENSRTLRLSSAIDPEAEDRALVNRAGLDYAKGVLCFGLGLGYHLEYLASIMDELAPIWVVESRPELAACAFLRPQLRTLMTRPGVKLFVGPFAECPWGEESPPPQRLWRPVTAREFSDEYPFGQTTPANFLSSKPRRFKRLLLFQGGYFLDREIKNAADELGLETVSWPFQRRAEGDGEEFKRLLSLVKNFRPEMALTINHLGFDAEGLMEGIFARLGLPVASWFVDSPIFILKGHRPGPICTAFTWDRDYIDSLESKPFRKVCYLPLASDSTIFKASFKAVPTTQIISFVGDSLTVATRKFLLKLSFTGKTKIPDNFLDEVDEAARAFLDRPDICPNEAKMKTIAAKFDMNINGDELYDLAALVTWRASRIKRMETLSAFSKNVLTVAGDESWARLLSLPANAYLTARDYYGNLVDFYQSSSVNLNISSAQMKSGLNQRVFDVPACGAFLLCDEQKQLPELFEPGTESVVYRSPAEAASLASWYERRPGARRNIAAAGHRRVLSQHLYRHRLAEMLKLM